MTPSRNARLVAVVVTLLLAVLSGFAALVAPAHAGPVAALADACEYVDLADPDAVRAQAAESDIVFYARLREPVPGGSGPADRIVRWQVLVVDAFGSDVGRAFPVVRFDTAMVPDTRLLAQGRELVLFAVAPTERQATGGAFDVDLCTAVGIPAGGRLGLDERRDIASALDGPEAEPAPETAPVAFEERDHTSVSLGRILAPGAALVLLGLLGLVLLSWAGRQRS